ncbi:AAA family ATPase [Desulfotomaculum copahuensis]|uniref:ATPase n=1 Tax=Desulfotomaculum copahuensis TaxID=1838280 RepID=A0A1B7LCH2_9FIRM|nr:ATP-binding protein [Desulfotomaculum copahuensis]OAT80396.1 ATPase [Desulfotomaculum copahuensis]
MPGKLFPLGGPVSEQDVVDREEFLSSLQIRLSEGHSIMLAGPRRTGKTSLAYEVLRRMKKQGFYTASIDLFRLSNKREFAISMINSCLENRTGIRKTFDAMKDRAKTIAGMARLTVKLEDLEFSLKFLDETNDDTLLDYALDLPEVLAKHDRKPMVVLLDEFQDALRITDVNIYKKMRSYFQNHQEVSYLFLGSKEGMMNILFSNRQEAFYRFATILPIPPISEKSWMGYITKKFAERKIKVSTEIIKEILKNTGGHPHDTMLVCSETYYALLEAEKNVVTHGLFRLGYDRALQTLVQVFDEVLDELSQRFQVRHILKRIAAGENVYDKKLNPNETKRVIDFLVSKIIIEKTGRGSYRFVEPMFQEYILREFS